MKPLTARQFEIFQCIKSYIALNGAPPTRAEIASHFGFKSCNAVEDHLIAIKNKGYITLTRRISRGIRIVEQPSS